MFKWRKWTNLPDCENLGIERQVYHVFNCVIQDYICTRIAVNNGKLLEMDSSLKFMDMDFGYGNFKYIKSRGLSYIWYLCEYIIWRINIFDTLG